jgi:hypothetical protein
MLLRHHRSYLTMLYQLEILQIVAVWVLTPGNYFSVIFSYISSPLKIETHASPKLPCQSAKTQKATI